MSVLDLQGMQTPETTKDRGGGSRGSKGCGPSGLSLLLC
jgi:hypothetical protein